VHSTLRCLRLGNAPEQDPSNSSFIGSCEGGKVLSCRDGLISGHGRPKGRQSLRVSTVKCHVLDKRGHGRNIGLSGMRRFISDVRPCRSVDRLTHAGMADWVRRQRNGTPWLSTWPARFRGGHGLIGHVLRLDIRPPRRCSYRRRDCDHEPSAKQLGTRRDA
jgi:hypothetical protein